MHKELIAKLLGVTVKSVYNYEKEERKIVNLLNKYFDDNDANEFLTTNKISKLENIRNNGLDQTRISEIIKLLTKYTAEHLALSLAICLESHGVISGTSKRLRKTTKKFDFLDDLDRILRDLISEDSKGGSTTFKSIIDSFNKIIGFDFDKNDQSIIDHIIIRYSVYNTLHDLDV